MLQWFKSAARDALPARYQVAIKYWYGAVRGDLEPEMELLPELVDENSHVADIGGNRGTYAFMLQKLAARLEIFEPNPACANILDQWAKSLSDVNVHRVALSDTNGLAILHIPIDEAGIEHDASASIEKVTEGARNDIQVRVCDLDSFGFNDLDFIKIDTEGHEVSVITGARKTIAASHPALLIEIEQRHLRSEPITEVFERILKMGYRGYFQRGTQLEPITKFEVTCDQSTRAFAANSRLYINNFLFLAEERIDSGQYAKLLRRVSDA